MDQYGITYLALHLDRANDQQRLFNLVLNDSWRELKLTSDFTGAGLADDFVIAIKSAITGGNSTLSYYILFCLLYGRIKDSANYYPVDALILMSMLGQNRQAVQLASLITDPVQKVKAYLRLSLYHFKSLDRENSDDLLLEADRIVSKIHDGDERDRAMVFLASSYGRFGNLDRALGRLELIRTVSVREKGMVKLAESLSEGWYISDALSVAQKIESTALRIDALASIEQCASKSDKFSELAVSIRTEVVNLLQRFDTTNIAPEFISRVVQALYSLDMLQEGDSIADQSLEPLWRVNGLRGLAQRGYPQLARSLLCKIPKKVLENASQEDIAQIYAAAGDFQNAIRTIKKIPESMRKNGAWAAVIRSLAKYKKYKAAMNWSKSIANPKMQLWALAGIGQALHENDHEKRAHKVLQGILKEISRLAIDTQSKHLSAFKLGENKKLNDEIFEAACKLSLDADQLHKATTFALKLNDIPKRTEFLLRLVQLFVNKREFAQAQRVVDLIDTTRRSKGLVIISKKMTEIENYKQALTTAESIENQKAKDDAWVVLAATSSKQGKFDQARKNIENISSIRARSQATSNLAINLAKAGSVMEAVDVADAINNPDLRAASYASIAPLVFTIGKEDLSLKLWSYCLGTHYQNLSTVLLSVKFVESGYFDKAIELTSQIEQEEQGDVWIGITNSLLQNGRWRMVDELQTRLESIFSNKVLWGKINHTIDRGMFDEAKFLIPTLPDERSKHNMARKLIATMVSNNENDYSQISSMAPKDAIIRADAKQGNIDQAIELTLKFIAPTGQDSTFAELVMIVSSQEDFDNAFKILRRIMSQYYKIIGLKRIVTNSLLALDESSDVAYGLVYESLEIFRQHGERSVLACLDVILPVLTTLVMPEIVAKKIGALAPQTN